MGFESIEGQRVALREFREEDVAAIEAWRGPHHRPLSHFAGEGRSDDPGRGRALVIERVLAAEAIGFIDYGVEEGWLAVRDIALAEGRRGWGYGSEAVRLLEEWAIREGAAERFRADVPVANGLALYFWLRLGYRPVSAGECGWPSDKRRDMMPMVRVGNDAGV